METSIHHENDLRISYSSTGSVYLSSRESEELQEILVAGGFISKASEVISKTGILSGAHSRDDRIVINVSGRVIDPLLLIRKLYIYFRSNLSELKQKANQFALVLKLENEKGKIRVGIDFKDVVSLDINFYRLYQYLKDPTDKIGPLGIVELEYPKRKGISQANKLSFLLAGLFAVFLCVAIILKWNTSSLVLLFVFSLILITNMVIRFISKRDEKSVQLSFEEQVKEFHNLYIDAQDVINTWMINEQVQAESHRSGKNSLFSPLTND